MENNDVLKKITDGILRVANPDDSYTQKDFDNEFSQLKTPSIDLSKLAVEFVNESTNEDPTYATAGSSAFDLRANTPNGVIIIESGEFKVIPTGLYFKLPPFFEIQVRPRSGLAAKNGVTVLNSPGTVDADYRGEVKVILINHGVTPFTISHGDRIAQAVVATVITTSNAITLKKVAEISADTDRGAGGFGSTGFQ